MFVCVHSCLVKCLSPVVEISYILYVKCLCVLSRYLSPVEEICYHVKCLCVLSRYLSPVVEISYMLNVYVCCLVISAQ